LLLKKSFRSLEREISAAALQMYFQYNFSVQLSLAAGANNLAL
jgi:hypothetical protein